MKAQGKESKDKDVAEAFNGPVNKNPGICKGVEWKMWWADRQVLVVLWQKPTHSIARLTLWLVSLNPAIFHPAISEKGDEYKTPRDPEGFAWFALEKHPVKISRFSFIMVETWAFDSQPGRLLKQLLKLGLKRGPCGLKPTQELQPAFPRPGRVHDHGL